MRAGLQIYGERRRVFMLLSPSEIKSKLTKWNEAWKRHDLKGVMQLFHEEILFENWTGAD
jgi:ketosteroid isomerase-like protein